MKTEARVLCADPPWKFSDKLPGATRGAERNYPCMSVEDICTFQLPPLANDCVLFLWRVASMQQAALDVVATWGFDPPQREVIWLKRTPRGRRWFGMGRVVRAEHEVCLIATRGKPAVKDHSVRSTFGDIEDDGLFEDKELFEDFEGITAFAGVHSEKPEAFYRIVETLYDGPYVELFSRRQRKGWITLGNEVAREHITLGNEVKNTLGG